MSISNLAYVDPKARLGKGVVVEPFAYIAGDVEIGDGSWIGTHAVVFDGSRLGARCRVFPGAVVGAIPQDLKFAGEYTTAVIGDDTTIRECATVNRGTAARVVTKIGNKCLIMAYAHVAHDCELGNNVILGNSTQLAGEVEVDDFAILSGGCLVHQFTRIGKHTMVQGGSRVLKDIPPYVIAGREPITFCGLNIVGLRRRGFAGELVQEIQEAYRILYREGLNVTQALEQIAQDIRPVPEKDEIINFIKGSSRGLIRGGKEE